MGLSTELISQFVKVTKDDSKPRGESLVHGTIVKIDDAEYVRLDGSDLLTPVESTAETENGERVTVSIKDHCATVTGNISSPSARIGTVNSVVATVDAQNNTIIQMNNTIDQQNNLITQIDNAVNQQGNTIVQINNKVTQQENSITQIGNTISQQGNTITQHGNSITQINSEIEERDSDISTLKSTVQTHQSSISTLQSNVQTQSSNISTLQSTVQTQGSNISTLDSTVRTHSSDIQIINSAFTINDGNVTGLNSVVTNSLEAKFANIDFANIGELAVKKIFADSGIIKDLVVDNHHITGELVGVTIKGDLIDANTIVADKLVVRGEDGILYKLNTTANLNEYGEPLDPEEQNEYNTLNGSVIAAKSITATKVNVEDLVAFDATIGGFNITESALYSGVKSSAGNTTRGIYLDKNGQLSVGDASNYLRYYKDQNNTYRLDISADSIKLGAQGRAVEDVISDTIENAIADVQIGGRNLVLNSSAAVTNSDHRIAIFQVASPLIEGETYTSTVCVTPAEGVTSINMGLSNGYILTASHPIVGTEKQIVSVTFTAHYASGRTPEDDVMNSRLCYYRKPNTGSVTGETTIHWVKVEKGNKATDYTPAPEDTDQKIDGIQIGGRNLVKTRDPYYVASSRSSNVVIDGNDIVLVYNDSSLDTYFELRLWTKLVANKEYTISFDCSGVEEGKVAPSFFISGDSNSKFTLANGRVYKTFVLSTDKTSNYIMLDDAGARPYETDIRLSNFKIEVGNKATDYTPAPEDNSLELEDAINGAKEETNRYADSAVELAINNVLGQISMLVTDSEGTSLMTQTSDGWTFRTTDIQNAINSTSEDLQELVEKASNVDSAITILQQSVGDLGTIAEYVKIGTYEGEPCIELGETDSDFKLRITNTKIMFLEGSNAPAYMNDESLFITKAVIEEELQQGNFIWRVRSNGNLGLSWIGE